MTNYVTITNLVFCISTNPVPVTLAGFDYQTCVALYYDGMSNGWPVAVMLLVCSLVVRGIRAPKFPSSQD